MSADLPKWAEIYLLPIVNLLVALIVCGVIVAIIGENPLEALTVMVKGAFVFKGSLGFTLYYTTNFIFTGLAVATAFHALMFNIGGEGQAYLGGLGAALAAFLFGPYLPTFVVIPLVIFSCAMFGALWALIPGYLQAYRGSHIVITTIMFNFLAASLMVWLLAGPMMQAGQQSPQTPIFPETSHIPKFVDVFGGAKSPFNFSFFIAIASLFLFWILIWKTRLGFEIRATGKNPDAAKYAGINVPRVIMITMIISGAFAGLMATNEIMGVHNRAILNFTNGFGFTGIAVALMGRNHPFGIFLAALLFGALFQGGVELDFEFKSITREMVLLIQGMVILFSGALAYMMAPALAWVLRHVGVEGASDG